LLTVIEWETGFAPLSIEALIRTKTIVGITNKVDILGDNRGVNAHVACYSLDSECAVDLQEVLKMSVSILQGLAVEWALLHHVDESWFKFKTVISDVHLWTSRDVGTGRS
jgi:hypothetical protein